MKRYALIGYPLEHSFSPGFFQTYFRKEGINAAYTAIPMNSLDQLMDILESEEDIVGFNITHPHKESILPYLSFRTKEVDSIGAANTVFIERGQGGIRLHGHNTDAGGFEASLARHSIKARNVLILGCGGASKALAWVMRKRGIAFHRLCRNPREQEDTDWNSISSLNIRDYDLIINSTPLGTYPETQQKPAIPYEALGEGQYLSLIHI
jgi:shikimate dehydrogenase